MAQRDLRPMKWLLGVADEPITANNRYWVTWRTSKIGGQADFMNVGATIPRCKTCDQALILIVQIYAPLEGSAYHRTLYVYGCVGRGCSSRSECWRVFRSQCLDEESEEGSKTVNSRMEAETTDWLDAADDWTFEEDDEIGGIEGSPSRLPSSWRDGGTERGTMFPDIINDEIYVSTVKLNQNEDCKTGDEKERVVMSNYVDEQGNRRPVVASKSFDNSLSEGVRKLQLSESVEGAVGISHGYDAEVEPPDEGSSITLDTPSMPSQDCIDALFGRESQPMTTSSLVLDSCFLAVVDEPIREKMNVLNDHERELLAVYQRQEGMNINELYRSQMKEGSDAGGGGGAGTFEAYEKSFVKHGDRTFQKLQARLGLCPQQLLRYCRNASVVPILVTSCKGEDLEPGKCQYCGSDMIFELQILPTTVNFMKIDAVVGKVSKFLQFNVVDDPVFEFGMVVVYTCQESCWSDDESWREEKVVIMIDPDETVFRALKSKSKGPN